MLYLLLSLPLMLSHFASGDFDLTADSAAAAWKDVQGVVTSNDRYGRPVPNARTEIRSRWTAKNLYFLFISEYEQMSLIPKAQLDRETWGLWDYDVVEVFIGYEDKHIERFKEFEVSPRGEWIDLDVDHGRPRGAVDWLWDSNFRFKTRIDQARKLWFCEMQIPWNSIDSRPVRAGNELRLNLYRIEGAPPARRYLAWSPVMSESFHTPAQFGRLRLAAK